MNKNYFEIFSLSQKFSIDEQSLENKYLKLQKKYHPDLNPDINQNLAAELNNAYNTLIQPLKRAIYLIKIIFDIDLLKHNNYKLKPDILMEMMEINENIAENKNNPEKLAKIQHKIEINIKKLFTDFEKNITHKNRNAHK